ncbi:MAG TPA: acyl-CoA dehydrogenase [Polyangiales bacterium]|jgi:butyryl-CoA dehydrogenase|nr:acyl-CoA dehydrogenase [Polyangiales bacterium]
MDLQLTPEQSLVQQTARDFATREVEPRAKHLDHEGEWPGDLVKRLGELGLMGVAIPAEYGGAGFDHVSYALAIEEISRGCASVGVIMSVNNSLACDPIAKHGSEGQKEQFLAPMASGKLLGCFGLTEPASGSDAGTMATFAEKDGDHWILNGSKNFITNGPHADLIVVFAMTRKNVGAKGITAFVVPTDTPGFSTTKPDEKLGIHAAHSCTVFFESCRIPDANRLGNEGDGFKVAMSTLDGGRIGIAAQAIGIARAAFEKAVAYSKERRAFGTPLAEKQAIQFMIADMATELDAARLLVQRAALLKDAKQRCTKESAMAKLYASEMSHRVAHKALQIFGGLGYTTECDAERHYRDARITEIYEGTSEIMRIVISANVLKG